VADPILAHMTGIDAFRYLLGSTIGAVAYFLWRARRG
jgi:hypothetical protein